MDEKLKHGLIGGVDDFVIYREGEMLGTEHTCTPNEIKGYEIET